jgi:MOSC domain-containing protein YiiM
MNGTARIVRISVSAGGVPKRPVPSAGVTTLGLEGDAQRDREPHGGPDRALCRFSHERIRALQVEGQPITPGSIGENLTIARVLREGALTSGDPVQLLTENEVLSLITRR